MKELKETKTSAALPTADDATNPATAATAQEVYVKPQIEVIELDLEQPLLNGGSNFGNGWPN